MSKSKDREGSNCGSPVSSSSDVPDSSKAVAPGSRSSDPPLLVSRLRVLRLRDINPPFTEFDSIERPIDIVQLTVKDVEFLNCCAYLTNVYRSHITSLGKVYLGEINSEDGKIVKVALLQYEQGDSQTVVRNAVASLAPKAVICTGCCGRLDPSRAELGDVVISSKLVTYDHKKIINGQEQNRGVRVNVTRHMSRLIRTADHGWNPPVQDPVYEGKVHKDKDVLSGSESVNDDQRKQFLENYRKAVGIETEGGGVYAAAYDLGIEWVIIKGISNYADGTENETKDWDHFASAMAASVVHHILKQPQVLTGFTHYKKPSDQ